MCGARAWLGPSVQQLPEESVMPSSRSSDAAPGRGIEGVSGKWQLLAELLPRNVEGIWRQAGPPATRATDQHSWAWSRDTLPFPWGAPHPLGKAKRPAGVFGTHPPRPLSLGSGRAQLCPDKAAQRSLSPILAKPTCHWPSQTQSFSAWPSGPAGAHVDLRPLWKVL